MRPQSDEPKKKKTSSNVKEKPNVEREHAFRILLVILGLIVVFVLDYTLREDSGKYTREWSNNSRTENNKKLDPEKPHLPNTTDRPSEDVLGSYLGSETREPYFVYGGTIIDALEELQINSEVVICRGKRACNGLYSFYSAMFSEQLGEPNIVRFDDGINRGDVASGWMFLDGKELILLSYQNNLLWREQGKYPEVKLILR